MVKIGHVQPIHIRIQILPCFPWPSPKEWNAPCRQLIVDNFQWYKHCAGRLCCCQPCIFDDLEGRIPEGTYEPDDPFYVKFHKVDAADLLRKQYCYTHNKQCPLFPEHPGQQSDIETAGLPCWDMSLAGNTPRKWADRWRVSHPRQEAYTA